MKFGVLRNIAGNIVALKDVDRQFDEFGVDAKVSLGDTPGLYPYVNECVEFLIARKYLALRTPLDDAFIGCCDGTEDFLGWSTIHLVEALKFAQRTVAAKTLEFLRAMPKRLEFNDVAFESWLTVGEKVHFLYKPEDVAAAFAAWKHRTVIHAAEFDPYVWREDLTRVTLSTGRNAFDRDGRILISTGGVGCHYRGSVNTHQPAAIVYDDENRTVHLLRPMCDVRKIFDRLRQTEYPHSILRCLEGEGLYKGLEYKVWRNVDA